MMRSPNLLDPRTALGAVKARPGIRRARCQIITTAGLDRPLRATRSTMLAGTKERLSARTKELPEMRSAR